MVFIIVSGAIVLRSTFAPTMPSEGQLLHGSFCSLFVVTRYAKHKSSRPRVHNIHQSASAHPALNEPISCSQSRMVASRRKNLKISTRKYIKISVRRNEGISLWQRNLWQFETDWQKIEKCTRKVLKPNAFSWRDYLVDQRWQWVHLLVRM